MSYSIKYSVESIREIVSHETGVPVALLSGDTFEECRNHAAELIDFRDSVAETKRQGKSTREQFAEWFGGCDSIAEEPETVRAYPSEVRTAGNADHDHNDSRTPLEAFREWFYHKSSYNPFQDGNWTNIM